MKIAAQPAEDPVTPRLGRPRSLTLDRLLDTAIELGLQDLSMKELAAKLGVGIATPYRYVANRDALIALAAGRQAYRQIPTDEGQSWQDLVRAYAESLNSSVGRYPHLLAGFIEGRLGTAVEIEFVDSLMERLMRRGFGPIEALDVYRAMGQIVLGGAVIAAHFKALSDKGTSQPKEVGRVLDEWEGDEVSRIRAASADYADEAKSIDWRPALEAVLRDTARARGEG